MAICTLAVFFSTPLAALATIAAAGSIPVVIHLLNRRRFRVVDWGAMRFLQAALKRSVRRLRLEHWLLLVVRTMLILLPLLAMAAMTPWAESLWQRFFSIGASAPRLAARTHHIIVLDASLSMTARRDDGSAFERAQASATNLVRHSPGGDAFTVIQLAAPSRAIVPGPANDPVRVAREIADLRCTHGTTNIAQGLQLAEDSLARPASGYARKVVYIMTDLQRSQWGASPSGSAEWNDIWRRLHEKTEVAIVDVAGGITDNVAVSSVAMTDSLITANTQSVLTATIQNFGHQDRKQVRVEFLQAKTAAAGPTRAGDQPFPPRVIRQEYVDIPAGGTATVSTMVDFGSAGDYRMEVRVGSDALAADNWRATTVVVRDELPVLLVNGRPAVVPFETATGWLAAAMDPFVGSTRPPGYPARPRIVLENQLANPDLNVESFDSIYLCDVPRISPRSRDRLDAYVRRGGTLIVGLGPSVDPETYQRLLFREGNGVLPARLIRRERAADGQYFSITADDDAFRRPPLAAFAADDDRAALMSARFAEYWHVELSPRWPMRRHLTFATSKTAGDPLLIEWSIGRGRTILFTSTFCTQWTGWPIAPSFPPFVQEFLRYSARQPARRDLIVGEMIDESLSERLVATDATVTMPDGTSRTTPIVMVEDVPRLQFTATTNSGLYSVAVGDQRNRVFAVNVPAGPESDLQSIGATGLPATGSGSPPLIVSDPTKVPYRPPTLSENNSNNAQVLASPVGTSIARWMLLAAFAILLVEPILAWRFGSARGPADAIDRPWDTPARRWRDRCLALLSSIPLFVVMLGALMVVHAAITGELLAFLPTSVRSHIESWLSVPEPIAGEGTRWRLERQAAFTTDAGVDRWLVGIAAFVALGLCVVLYMHELRRSSRWAAFPLVGLRLGMVLLSLFVLLPQLQLVFEREDWPDVVVLIDDSQSMGVADQSDDPAIKSAGTALTGKQESSRLQLAQALLDPDKNDLLRQLSLQRQARLHVFRISDRLVRLAECDTAEQLGAAVKAVKGLQPTGVASRLGDSVRTVLEEFRGSSLANLVVLTDGVTTDGDDLSAAARHALRSGVTLTLIGIGDAKEPKDLSLSDLRVDDVIHLGDRLVFEARLTARGELRGNVAVVLSEKQNDRLSEVGRQDVSMDPSGAPTKVRLTHSPKAPGEHTYVLEVQNQIGESDVANNRLERSVFVAEFKRTRVLFIEGRPRYDFRFAKTLLERETESVRGNKSIDLKVLLTDADLEYSRQDRSALESFPISREELFNGFDVVVIGDVDPNHPLLGEKRLQWLADFVREKGGGMLFLCGSQSMPRAFRGTPLADVLPVDPAVADAGGSVRPSGFRLRLTANGRLHPVVRFVPDDQGNLDVWSKLKPMFWAATGLKPKPAAEVLATVPPMSGSGDGDPMLLQQFVGAGRVMLLGFEETWRWRFRNDEIRFNQFWIQMMRFLARTRPSRPEVRLDRQTPYRSGEPIRVHVHFPEDKPAPAADTPVRVQVERITKDRSREQQILQLAAIPGARGSYESIIPRTHEGTYVMTLVGAETGPGRAPSAEAKVLPQAGEMDRLRMNRVDMERAAQISRGHFYTLAEVDRLVDELPPVPHVTLNRPRPPWPIWNTPFIVVLSLAMLGTEWVLRKRQQLL